LADISSDDGAKIVAEAATWKGTAYSLLGKESSKGTGGDCSGSTYKIYGVAGFSYDYRNAASFPDYATKSGHFRKLDSSETKQEGDILWWPDHMAVFSSFASDDENATTPRVNRRGQPWTQTNDMWTATHDGGGPYGPAQMHWFKPGPPVVYRYQKSGR
jgi:hypothetical protein